MDLFSLLTKTLGLNPQQASSQRMNGPVQQTQQSKNMIPVGQPIPQSYLDADSPQLRQLSQIYNQNPQDPRVAHIDPRVFGYAPDNTVAHPQNQNLIHILTAPTSGSIQGQQNPGYIPLQNSGFGGPGYVANLQPTRTPYRR